MSVDWTMLEQQLAAVPDSARWSGRPEVRDLAELLNPGESVVTAATGWLVESGKLAIRTWLITVTTHRLICLLKGGSGSVRKVEMPISVMKSAHTESRLGYFEVLIDSSNGKMILSGLPKESAVALSAALLRSMGHIHGNAFASAAQAANAGSLDVIDEGASGSYDNASVAACIAQVKHLEAELAQTQQRLSVVEDVIRRAAARSAAAKTSSS